MTCANANPEQFYKKKEKTDLMTFTWNQFYDEIQIRAPNTFQVVSAIASDIPVTPTENKCMHILYTLASGLHGKTNQMSAIQYGIAMILLHGGCTHRDIDRLCKLGICVSSSSLHNKLASWIHTLDEEVLALRTEWEKGGTTKYQLVGDNWDKNIIPSFRTSQQKTTSLHLFNVIAVVDRISSTVLQAEDASEEKEEDVANTQFIPSVQEQDKLLDELAFLVATSVIEHIPELKQVFKFYPKHLNHKHSQHAGIKTKQFPLGLFDCNEMKTAELIKLMKNLQAKYVPCNDETIVEPVFFGGDRLTDERFQAAQMAMMNGAKPTDRIEGFISKIEDFHRLMNFLEAICKLTYSTDSGRDRGSVYYLRNMLNARNVKGDVRNHYRAYKLLYYTVLDAMCCLLFLKELGLNDFEENIPFPENFEQFSQEDKIAWINEICRSLLRKHFFDSSSDIFSQLREILADANHPENYWTSQLKDSRVKCHFCEKTYAYVGSLKVHEEKIHNAVTPQIKAKRKSSTEKDEVQGYCLQVFKLSLLHKNLDSAVDMADGDRSVKSAKYELPVYNLTNKTKYAIGSIHLITLLESSILNEDQKQRLVANRFINLQGGRNNNMALDEYVELLNRESKDMCSGFQTKESILAHSKECPHMINYVNHYDDFCCVSKRKGFHHLPSYSEDVKKVALELADINAFSSLPGRKLHCKAFSANGKFYDDSFRGLGTLIHRHKPVVAFHRLRNKRI